MHMCCGPCAVFPTEQFKKEGWEIYGLFYNPNIHPYKEYEKRLETAKSFADKKGIELIVLDEYNLDDFLRNAVYRENIRCRMCYSDRLDRAASVAKKGNFDAFTTTLLISPYQKHELIKDMGESAGKKYGVDFLYNDLRKGFKEGHASAREMGLYMQQYCGCIYSEAERYKRR